MSTGPFKKTVQKNALQFGLLVIQLSRYTLLQWQTSVVTYLDVGEVVWSQHDRLWLLH